MKSLAGRWLAKQSVLTRSVWMRWSGRSCVTKEQTPIKYGQELRLMVVVTLVLSALEVLAGILLIPWKWLEILVTVSGLLSMMWVYGFIAAVRVCPHVVDGDAVVLRFAHSHQVRIPLTSIVAVGLQARANYTRTLQVEPGSLALSCLGATNVILRLSAESKVEVINCGRGDGVQVSVNQVMFAVDQPREAVLAIRNRLQDITIS